MVKCKECKRVISAKSGFCPYCGGAPKQKTSLFAWIIAGGLLFLIISSQINQTYTTHQESTRADDDINKMTTYAVILGRAIACGADVQQESKRVGAWMDIKFPPGSKEQQTYLPIFMEGVKYHAGQQKNGKSPDTCSTVLRVFSEISWP